MRGCVLSSGHFVPLFHFSVGSLFYYPQMASLSGSSSHRPRVSKEIGDGLPVGGLHNRWSFFGTKGSGLSLPSNVRGCCLLLIISVLLEGCLSFTYYLDHW